MSTMELRRNGAAAPLSPPTSDPASLTAATDAVLAALAGARQACALPGVLLRRLGLQGTAAAFVTTKEDPDINQPTIDYVASFVPDETGTKFNPHVTIGIATQDYLKKMLDEKFEAFTFSPAGASVYHLGNFGTARKKLKGWELKR